MGITIHYSGRAMNAAAVSRILDIAPMFAAQRGWQFAIYDDPFGVMEDRDMDDPGWIEHDGPYRGVIIKPHPGCEPVRLDFAIDHELRPAFTKTQFAPFDVHKEIVALLREIEPHMDLFAVVDEAGLWESGDEAAAMSKFETLGRAIGDLADTLRAHGSEVEGPAFDFPPENPYDPDGGEPRGRWR